jgi:hypothetical protein
MARVGFLSRPGGLSMSPQPSLFPSLKTLLVKIFVLLKFVGAGVVGSLFPGLHEEFVKAVKYAALEHPEAGFVRSNFSAF